MKTIDNFETENFCKEGVPPVACGASPIDPDWLATLAHEIRNILAPLSMSADLLNLPNIEEEAQRRANRVVGRQVRQLRRLVNDLLDSHRLDRDELELTLRSTELTKAVEAICDDHCGVFAAQGVTLIADVMANPLWIKVDLDRIEQALNNLLSNSLKFTDRGGFVRVGVCLDADSQFSVISVRDNGVGIEPAVMARIFHPHAHATSPRNRSGLGLGLPLAKRLVEAHGGRLVAHSAGAGKGSEFRILLPRSAAEQDSDQAADCQ
jgi:signal transduction histidine kinase